MWDASRTRAGNAGFELPDFDSFWAAGMHKIPDLEPRGDWLADFRADPQRHPLSTPSGKIEIFSATIAGFDYADCPGHPCWLEPFERIGGRLSDTYPLHLVSNQPAHRLHSQLDHSSHSRKHKIADREVIRIHPEPAAARGITDGMTVRVFNDRGACLAAARLDDRLMPEVVELPTGAWFNPLEPGVPGSLELAGNPNVLTRDKGTSSLAQGPSANTCLVDVEPFTNAAPPPTVYDPPELVSRD
jgi:biotin/methionine sulfoxide reductase